MSRECLLRVTGAPFWRAFQDERDAFLEDLLEQWRCLPGVTGVPSLRASYSVRKMLFETGFPPFKTARGVISQLGCGHRGIWQGRLACGRARVKARGCRTQAHISSGLRGGLQAQLKHTGVCG
eukprot:1159955-Pelagomonas_calceolata.AAC.5